jgi:hypothetical protein
MDYRAGLTAGTRIMDGPRAECVRAEQAIFTSIRTPMGEGYRLIAMSPGITSEERAEITRRSPSHGSLCDPDPAASALSSYPLATQRQCVAWTRYAGREHTARGGQRVHTHLAVLDREGFAAMACDPFRVHAAMRQIIGDEPCLKPATCMECLQLSIADDFARDTLAADAASAEHACRIASALLNHKVMLVVGAVSPVVAVRTMFAVLPHAWRVDLAVSANLQYAPARQFRLTCVGQNTPELQRAVHGQNVHVLDLGTSSAAEPSCYDAWFEFTLERERQGRLAECVALADQIDGHIDGPALERVVAVCRDADRVELASQSVLEQLVTVYANAAPTHPIEKHLVRNLLSAAVRRASQLQHPTSAAMAAAAR